MAPLGLIVAGSVADVIGVQSWYVIGGVACILLAVVGYSLPALMNIEGNHRNAGKSAQKQVKPVGSEGIP
jgi:DHA3 family macrolide efflux protein-like MFS transporter